MLARSRRIWLLSLFGLLTWIVSASGAEANRRTFDAQGVKIGYLIEGQGPAVVLIHGLHSSAAINWQLNGVVADLAKDHRVIALDLPGHGQSDKPAKNEAYGLQLVEDIVLLLDHLKIEKAQIVGYSLGGMVALKFIAKHPERSLSGCLGGMGWLRDGGGLQKFWELLGRRGGAAGLGPPPEFLQGVGELALTEQELRAITIPVEVVVGSRDPVKKLYVDALSGVRNDWKVVEILGAGHMDCILKPEFRDALGKWIRKSPK